MDPINEEELSAPQAPSRKTNKYVVRCGVNRTLCLLKSRDDYHYGSRVIARTPRGLEVGEVLCVATDRALSFMEKPPEGQILRAMTAEDELESLKLQQAGEEAFATCKRVISEMRLPMQLVDVESVFGGERMVVFYLAENRVDFRELVRCLAGHFQTRIEMRQIGVRDQARLLADYGDCGKPVCCNTHLTQMPPVSMKMAKLQKATLDPSKISGRCGRLKCCLRYEYETYVEMQRELPPVGSQVVTREGRATVLAHEILSQQFLVMTEDQRRILLSLEEVLSVTRKPFSKKKSQKKHAQRSADDSGQHALGKQDSNP